MERTNTKCFRHWLRIRDNVDEISDYTILISQNEDRMKKRHVQSTASRAQEKTDLDYVQVSPYAYMSDKALQESCLYSSSMDTFNNADE